MNYRHAYHAGNFADVLKHAVLARVIAHLALKRAPFRVIDTHAGVGFYDLGSDEALRTGEWRDGIGRLLGPGAQRLDASPPQPARDPTPPQSDALSALLEPYLSVVAALNPEGRLMAYPGSPAIMQALARDDDTIIACELHPVDAATLGAAFARDRRVKVLALDGWAAIKSLLPPKERRGVILVDPPFEAEGDFDRLVRALADGVRRFATGTYIAWYPIKDLAEVEQFHAEVVAAGLRRLLAAELAVAPPRPDQGLSACGLLIVNPPWTLAAELEAALPLLAARLARTDRYGARCLWLVPEETQPAP